ncbi:MAG: MlaD family protein [Elusimicrobiota bacterium]
MISVEAKVGAFLLAGMALFGTAIFLLGDYTFQKRYDIYVDFTDVSGLSVNSPVKLSGVEVGEVTGIDLIGGTARVKASIREGIAVYKDADFEVGSTGIIGSKYLQIDQGHSDAGLLSPGSEISGLAPVSIEKQLASTLESVQGLLKELDAKGPGGRTLADNLRQTMTNVRRITANLNDLIASTEPGLKKAVSRADGITEKLDTLLAQSNDVMASLNSNKGAVGALLHDPKVKADVTKTLDSVQKAAANVNDIISRVNQFRVYWNYDWRYASVAGASHSDFGLKIAPRDGRYYYFGVENLGNPSNIPISNDYEKLNTVDGLLGMTKGPFDLAVGSIRSAGGARVTVTPFYKSPVWGRFSVMAQGYNFSRDIIIDGRRFNHPEYDTGILAKINQYFSVGARVDDLETVKTFETWLHVNFEDKDVASLFGLAVTGAAGAKGRSKSGP